MLEDQKYSGTELPPIERLSRTMETLDHYIQYLRNGSWSHANIFEIVIVGRVVFDQFYFAQEFLKSEGARELTNQIEKQFRNYLDSIIDWSKRTEEINYDKNNAIDSLQNMYDSLDIILQLENNTTYQPSSKRTRTASTDSRHKSILDWEEAPLPYEKWVNTVSKNVSSLSEHDRSLQWALYVFKLPSQPNTDQRKEAYYRLSNKFHPDKGGATEIMQIINGANQILKLYE